MNDDRTWGRLPGSPTRDNQWQIDWQALIAAAPEIGELSQCPQDPVFHAEGDVLTHTQMVCQQLTEMPSWRELDESSQDAVFMATLLHDIAKPQCTREEDGRISSRGHAVQGAFRTRALFWEQWPDDCASEQLQRREAVCGLVRHHGLPLYCFQRRDPQRAVIEASMTARLDWVALLAEADVRGRICNDRAELLERVALFRELAAELNCLDRPYEFANPHTRLQFFRKTDLPPTAELYDDTRFEVTLMSGLPASGKDHWIASRASGLEVISLDDIREQLEVDPAKTQGAVANEARRRARELLRRQQPLVWNATNTTRQLPSSVLGLMHDYGARVRIVYLETSASEQHRRNRSRPRPVPDSVIARLRGRLEPPTLIEAARVDWVAT